MAQPIRIVRQGAITRITIDRADASNRVTNEMAATLAGAIGSAGAEGTHLVVLAGEGADFCLGREVPASAEDGTETAVGIRAANTEPALALFATFQRCSAPILGIVQGRATGMGCAMAALCDVTLAADDARFLVPEMDRDLPPTLVMWALADRLTRKAASYLVYSREPMDAQAALSAGLVSRVVAGGRSRRRGRGADRKARREFRAGPARGQGIHAQRARDGPPGRGRFRLQPARQRARLALRPAEVPSTACRRSFYSVKLSCKPPPASGLPSESPRTP